MPSTPAPRVRRHRWLSALALLALVAPGLAWSASASAQTSSPTSGPSGERSATSGVARANHLAGEGCRFKPSARNTGAHGRLRPSGVTHLGSHGRLRNAHVSNLVISGSNVVVRNVQVDGGVLVTGDHVTLRSVSARSIAVSSGQHVVVQRANVGNSDDDAFHVTSDRGRQVRSVVLRYNYVHHPAPPEDAHFDGLQVRGVDNLVVRCNTIDAGDFRWNYNAGVFLEDANGGDSHVSVVRTWIYGFAFSVMVETPSSQFVANRLGGDPHWGACHAETGRFYSRGNVWTPSGSHISLCGQG